MGVMGILPQLFAALNAERRNILLDKAPFAFG
jgi:hypothetical protein